MVYAGFGALAQLGEHLLCKQRVIGSIPIGSTRFCGSAGLRRPLRLGCRLWFAALMQSAGFALGLGMRPDCKGPLGSLPSGWTRLTSYREINISIAGVPEYGSAWGGPLRRRTLRAILFPSLVH